MARVVLAMSGGVDSSVAAHLLREQGHDCIGLFMRHGEPLAAACETGSASAASLLPIVQARPGHKQGCCSATDADDARRIADQLDIPFYAINFESEFGRIMDYFVDEYTAGRTPNPCVVCNNWLKFGKLCDYADSVGAEFIATGHYVRLLHSAGNDVLPTLHRGLDASKDQSYVLFGINRQILPRLLFPVGEYRKEQIRALAEQLGMRVADKKDSQEICFVTDDDYAGFVQRRRGPVDTTGEVVTTEGHVVGQHAGIEHFTIGQRKGLGVAFGEPRYVVRLEPDTRRVVIGTADELLRDELTATDTNWLIDPPTTPFDCQVQIRYNSPPVAAHVIPHDNRLEVQLAAPRRGIAPGQALVCYQDDQLLGGGWIE